MKLSVYLFGPAREAAGTGRATVTVGAEPTVANLLTALATAHPGLEALLARSRVAVNHVYADAAESIAAEDEIAVIPPVGGG
ncbi:MAG: MoaD/ThiS family protein [Gemmatimonadota bacterium]